MIEGDDDIDPFNFCPEVDPHPICKYLKTDISSDYIPNYSSIISFTQGYWKIVAFSALCVLLGTLYYIFYYRKKKEPTCDCVEYLVDPEAYPNFNKNIYGKPDLIIATDRKETRRSGGRIRIETVEKRRADMVKQLVTAR